MNTAQNAYQEIEQSDNAKESENIEFHSTSKVLRATVTLGNEVVTDIVASGAMVSTPTGSTAYALSAGGAVVAPDLPAFLFTPILSNKLASRPFVYSNAIPLKIELSKKSANGLLLCDGTPIAYIEKGASVEIFRAEQTLTFIRRDKNFPFKKLQKRV